MNELIAVGVPTSDVGAVRRALEERGLAGHVLDAVALGFPGWVVARVAAVDDEVLVLKGPEVPEECRTADDLAADLGATWPGTQVDVLEIEGVEPMFPLLLSPDLPATTVAVAPAGDLMLGVFAQVSRSTIHTLRVDDRLVVGIAPGDTMVDGPEPADDGEPAAGAVTLEDDVLVDALVNARGVAVVLWRRGPCTGLHLLRRGKHRHAHVWEPTWTAFGHPDLDGLRSDLRPVEGDAAVIAGLLDLPEDEVVALRALLRREDPDLAEVARLLRLPSEVTDVLAGRITVADLPGAVEERPPSFREMMAPSEHDPRWMRVLDGGARELRPWYVVSALVWIAVCVWLVVGWRGGGSTSWGVVGLVTGLAQVLDLVVRWVARRRRGRTGPTT